MSSLAHTHMLDMQLAEHMLVVPHGFICYSAPPMIKCLVRYSCLRWQLGRHTFIYPCGEWKHQYVDIIIL